MRSLILALAVFSASSSFAAVLRVVDVQTPDLNAQEAMILDIDYITLSEPSRNQIVDNLKFGLPLSDSSLLIAVNTKKTTHPSPELQEKYLFLHIANSTAQKRGFSLHEIRKMLLDKKQPGSFVLYLKGSTSAKELSYRAPVDNLIDAQGAALTPARD